MPTRNVDLTDSESRFIDTGIASGRFTDASEAVRAGLDLLERQEVEEAAKLEWLRTSTQHAFAALDRGEGIPLSDDIDGFVSDVVGEVRAAPHITNA